jgi:hypothetical protein
MSVPVRRSLHYLAAVCCLALLLGCRPWPGLTPTVPIAVSPLPAGTIPSVTLNDDATTREVAFTDGFTQQFVDLNSSLSLYLNADMPTSGSSLNLVIENRSGRSIWFPQGFNIRVLTYEAGEHIWIELNNRVTYGGPEGVTLEPLGSDLAYAHVLIGPELPTTDEPIVIRVLVSGEFYEAGQPIGERVGAFTDIRVEP